jgi:hypothetical protein
VGVGEGLWGWGGGEEEENEDGGGKMEDGAHAAFVADRCAGC